jgi:hypothetical protein
LSYKFAWATQTAFAVLLIGFILYVTYHDVARVLRITDFGKPKDKQEIRAPQFEGSNSTAPPKEATTAPAMP